MCFVGPRHTEYASTHGMTSATRTTHDSSSKKPRNHHATNVIAPSFEKSAAMSSPARSHANASTPRAIPSGRSPRARQSGSAIQTRAKTAGMTTNASHATSHHSDASHRSSAEA